MVSKVAFSCFAMVYAASSLTTFYDRFLCEEKKILSSVGLSSSCDCGKCGSVPYPSNAGYTTPNPILYGPQVWSFVSEPDLHPMKITVNTYALETSSGFVFLAPYSFSSNAMYGQPGALIVDNGGNPLWFRPLDSPNLMNTDFRVQKLYGEPVLTFWQGTLATSPAYTNSPPGSSEPGSCYYIVDNTYTVLHTVSAKKGWIADIHEFLITPANTALFLSTKAIPMDLTPYGGPQDGYVQDFAIQEIDLQTGELIFFWDALEHIPLTDSYEAASSATSSSNIWDAYHLNSIGLTGNATEIVVSGRNTWTIYTIDKTTNNILWQLGGKSSSFAIGEGAAFSWQHDARFLGDNLLSLFDDNSDGSSQSGPPSHGLILQLDFVNKTADLYRSYYHDPSVVVGSQGNVQSLSNGNIFIGWGASPYYSEYRELGNTEENPAENVLYDAEMPGPNFSYRAYRNEWSATPAYPPSIAISSMNGQIVVYASWNGSTETALWQVWAGPKPKKLSLVNSSRKEGFETTIPVSEIGPYFQVKALNIYGQVIGQSNIEKWTK